MMEEDLRDGPPSQGSVAPGSEQQASEDWPRLEESIRSLLFGSEAPSGPPPVKPFQGPPPQQSPSGKDQRPKPNNKKGAKMRANVEIDDTAENEATSEVPMTREKLRAALLEECIKEDFALLQVGSENFNEKLTHYRRPEFVSQYLKRHDIRPLKKKSEKFPKALYYCRLCDYHCDRLSICIQHIEDTRHSRLTKMQEVEITLFHLPKPTKHHLDTLEQLLMKIEKDFSLSVADLQSRASIETKLDAILKKFIPGCAVRMYGSSLSGFGLIDSDVNLDLQIPDTIRPDQALIIAYDVILRCQEFENVQRDFCAKIPVISFNVGCLRCELSLHNNNAYQTSLLLRDYFFLDPCVRTLSTSLRLWAKLCMIDRQAEGTLPAHAFPLLLVFFLQQGKKPILPCIHDQLVSRDQDVYERPSEYLSSVKIRNSYSVAELWIEFFEFYSLGFNVNDDVVSIRNVGGFSRDEKQWKGKKLAIEDPFSSKRSLTRSVNNPHNLDFITDCFKIAYLYFGTVQTTQGPTVTKIVVPDSPPPGSVLVQESPEDIESTDASLVENIFSKLQIGQNELGPVPNMKLLPSKIMTLEELERSFNIDRPNSGESNDEAIFSFESFRKKNGTELTPKQALQVAKIVPKNMILFKFDQYIFTGGQGPILVCTVCGREGHLQSTCPDENLPPLRPLPPMSPDQKAVLNRICSEVMLELEPSNQEQRDREFILRDMSRFIGKSFPTAKLTLYGSSCNGFAIAHSDLDISLTFSDHLTVESINAIEIIDKLAEKLKRMQGIGNIQPITSAKVPILKFIHYESQIEGDISLYNILAQENTRMLGMYAAIDSRVKILGYMVKFFAKVCDIGDASRGSLSSYAYILMLIHYLQQVNPPVLPVLQELYPGDVKPVNIVDGWNAWFFDKVDMLKQIWPRVGQNQLSVAELWIGFLEYYAAGFNDKNLVVCVRQLTPLTKFEKMWNSPCIAIEDPFDLDHNLGAGLSRKMNLFIKKAFMKSRDHFGTPMPLYMSISDLKNHLFDSELMSDGLPPNDRGCRACGKIGHLVRDCPRKKNSDERKKRERREKNDARNRTISEREKNDNRNRTISEREKNDTRNRTLSERENVDNQSSRRKQQPQKQELQPPAQQSKSVSQAGQTPQKASPPQKLKQLQDQQQRQPQQLHQQERKSPQQQQGPPIQRPPPQQQQGPPPQQQQGPPPQRPPPQQLQEHCQRPPQHQQLLRQFSHPPPNHPDSLSKGSPGNKANSPEPDPHFMSLLAGMGLDSNKVGSNVTGPIPLNLGTERPPPLPSMSQAMTLEELERSFEVKQNSGQPRPEMDQRSVAPPPGFGSAPSPIGHRASAPVPIGHQRPQQLHKHSPHLDILGHLMNPFNLPVLSSPQQGHNFPANPLLGGQHHQQVNHQPMFGSYDPREVGPITPHPLFPGHMMPMPPGPGAFNPFNSFGPICPGQPQSLMMQSLSAMPKQHQQLNNLGPQSPSGPGSPVQMNHINPNSAFGLPNFGFPQQPLMPAAENSLGFGSKVGEENTNGRQPEVNFSDFLALTKFGLTNPGYGGLNDSSKSDQPAYPFGGWP